MPTPANSAAPQSPLGPPISPAPHGLPGAGPGNLPGPPGVEDVNPGNVHLMLNAPIAPVPSGTTFKAQIVLAGGKDIASIPFQVQYDPAKLTLVNVGAGDFLSKDGKAVSLAHRDDPPGSILINPSRPPGAAGVSGAGVVCVLTFQAKAAGTSALAITNPMPKNSAQHPVPATGSQVSIVVK